MTRRGRVHERRRPRRLRPPSDAPAAGEQSEELAQLGGVVVEQILSGALGAPVDYDQDHDEWVVVLDGAATLVVEGETITLSARRLGAAPGARRRTG